MDTDFYFFVNTCSNDYNGDDVIGNNIMSNNNINNIIFLIITIIKIIIIVIFIKMLRTIIMQDTHTYTYIHLSQCEIKLSSVHY